jgi:hypothetical protein
MFSPSSPPKRRSFSLRRSLPQLEKAKKKGEK